MLKNQTRIISRRLLLIIGLSICLQGCGTIKKAALTGGTTALAVGAASALSSGVLVPAAVGGVTASVVSAGALLTTDKKTKRQHKMESCAPTNFGILDTRFLTLSCFLASGS